MYYPTADVHFKGYIRWLKLDVDDKFEKLGIT